MQDVTSMKGGLGNSSYLAKFFWFQYMFRIKNLQFSKEHACLYCKEFFFVVKNMMACGLETII